MIYCLELSSIFLIPMKPCENEHYNCIDTKFTFILLLRKVNFFNLISALGDNWLLDFVC